MSDLRAELAAIRADHGKLTPRIVLEAARPKSHPLHSRVFDKSVPDAAEAYYLSRAQDLITLVRVSYTNAEGETKSVRGFHAVRASDAEQYEYEPVEEVLADPFKRKMVMQDMTRQVDELVARFDHLSEFWDVLRKAVRRKKAGQAVVAR